MKTLAATLSSLALALSLGGPALAQSLSAGHTSKPKHAKPHHARHHVTHHTGIGPGGDGDGDNHGAPSDGDGNF
jgi:hypothetical protein